MKHTENRLMTIGEIARTLGITRRIILNYEAKGLVVPDKKDSPTGNRYYTADTLTKIRTIRVLQNLGLSLDEISGYYNGTLDMKNMITRLELLRDELNLNIEKLKERVKTDNSFDIRIVHLASQTIYCMTLRADTVEKRKEHLRDIIPSSMRQYTSDTSRRMYFIEYPLEDHGLISYCISVVSSSRGEHIRTLPDEQALSLFYHGSYESIPAIRDQMIAYAQQHRLTLKGTCRHIYLEGPPSHTDPDKFITQIILPLA